MGFWVDNSFSFRLVTPPYRLDKDASAARPFVIEFMSPEQSATITGVK